MRTVMKWQMIGMAGICALAAACANTSSGGGAAADTGSGADTGTAADTASGTDAATGVDTTTTGTDATTAGSTTTIAQIQQDPISTGCTNDTGFVDGAKGITLSQVVVVSPVDTSTSKTSGKTSDAVWVQTQGGGQWSGVELYASSPGPLTNLKVGQIITVTGDVSEAFCVTEIKPIAVTPQGTTALPTAVTLDVDSIGASQPAATNESYESVLISLAGVIVADPGVLGTDGKIHYIAVGKSDTDKSVLVSSGFGIYVTDKNGNANYTKGQKLNVQGIVSYYKGQYTVTPLAINVAN